jgi:hypothetical protein
VENPPIADEIHGKLRALLGLDGAQRAEEL